MSGDPEYGYTWQSASSLPADNNFFAASGTTNWSLTAGRTGLLGQLYNENASGTASASGSGVESYNDSQNFSYDPVAGWSAASGTETASGSGSVTFGYTASGGSPITSGWPYSTIVSTWSGSVSGSASATESYGYSTNSTYASTTNSWISNGSASATFSGSTNSSFSASSPLSLYSSLLGYSASGTATGSGSNWANWSYTETQDLVDNTWASASGTGWTSAGASASFGYSGSGSYWNNYNDGSTSGTFSGSGSETYSNTLNTTASISDATTGSLAGLWVQSGSQNILSNAAYDGSYQGSGSGALPNGDFTGTWNQTGSGSASATGTYKDQYTFTPDALLPTETAGYPNYSGDTANEDSYHFDSYLPTMRNLGSHSGSWSTTSVVNNDVIVNHHTSGVGYGFSTYYSPTTTTTYGGSGTANLTYSGSSDTDPDFWSNDVNIATWTPNTGGSNVTQTDHRYGSSGPDDNGETWDTTYDPITDAAPGFYFGAPGGYAGPGTSPLAPVDSTQLVSLLPNNVTDPPLPDANVTSNLMASNAGLPQTTNLPGPATIPLPDAPALPTELLTPLDSVCSLNALLSRPAWPATVTALWGMNFVAVAGYGGTGSTYFSAFMPPVTTLAAGNNPSLLPAFTSVTIAGAGGVFGSSNVAPAVPLTQASRITMYGASGINAGANAPAGGGLGNALLNALGNAVGQYLGPLNTGVIVPIAITGFVSDNPYYNPLLPDVQSLLDPHQLHNLTEVQLNDPNTGVKVFHLAGLPNVIERMLYKTSNDPRTHRVDEHLSQIWFDIYNGDINNPGSGVVQRFVIDLDGIVSADWLGWQGTFADTLAKAFRQVVAAALAGGGTPQRGPTIRLPSGGTGLETWTPGEIPTTLAVLNRDFAGFWAMNGVIEGIAGNTPSAITKKANGKFVVNVPYDWTALQVARYLMQAVAADGTLATAYFAWVLQTTDGSSVPETEKSAIAKGVG